MPVVEMVLFKDESNALSLKWKQVSYKVKLVHITVELLLELSDDQTILG